MKRTLAGIFILGLIAGCHQPATHPCPTSAPSIAIRPAVAEEISVEQLALLLPRHPIVVGFDVDDTLLASTPAFSALQSQYDPQVIRPKDFNALTPAQKAQFHDFWNRLNEDFDDRSIPKKIGKQLLDLHLARGDEIWIISRRPESDPPTKTTTLRIERMFGVKLSHPVVSTNLSDKTNYICCRHIEYYYGDSDTDITAAVAAGAVPIRVHRAAGSYAADPHHDGQLGEIVLKGSDQ